MNKKSTGNTPNQLLKPLNGSDNNAFIPTETDDSTDKILKILLCLSVCYVTSGENRGLSWNQEEHSAITVDLQIIHGWSARTFIS